MQGGDKITYYLKEAQPFSSVKLNNIISFYEMVEDRLFSSMIEFVSPDFKKEISDSVQKSVREFLKTSQLKENIGKYPSIQNLINVTQRFIIRCLLANIEPKFPIKEYMMRTDFWDLNVSEDVIDKFYFDFPDEIIIANTLPLLEILKITKESSIETKDNEKIDILQEKERFDSMRQSIQKKKNKFI